MRRITVVANKVNTASLDNFTRSITEHRIKVNTAKPLSEPARVPHKDIQATLRTGTSIPIRLYRSQKMYASYPTIFYVPGTAFVAKEIAFTDVICSNIAEKSNCQVIVINHRLAPEDQFPHGLDDAYYLLKLIIKSPNSSFNIDKNKIAIIGYSSGGNFAASMSAFGKAEGLPIARQILISPLLDLSRSLKDFKEFEDKDTTINEPFVEWFLKLYLPEGINLKTPLLSPFWQEESELRGLPPTDIIFAENDRFRSDSEAYHAKLMQAGVNTYKMVVPGEDHSFLWYNGRVVADIGSRIKIAFGLELLPHPILSRYEQELARAKEQIERHKQNLQLDTHRQFEPSGLMAKL
jgi:acetyl esterase